MVIALIVAILLAFAGGYIVGAALTAWQYDRPDKDRYGEDEQDGCEGVSWRD